MVEGRKPPGLKPYRFVVGGRASFGRQDDVTYQVPEDTTPVQLAAAAAQHRLIAEFRRRTLNTGHFSRVTLDMSASSFERLVDGRKEATMVDLVSIAAAVGIEILGEIRPDDSSFIPPGVRALEPGWTVGRWTPPRYAAKPERLEDIDWVPVIDGVVMHLDERRQLRTLHALEGASLASGVLDALARQGIDPALASSTRDSEFDVAGLVLDLPHVAVVGMALETATGDRPAALRSLRRVVTLLYGLSAAEERFAVLVLSQDVVDRLDGLAPGIGTAVAGDRAILPFATARSSLPDDTDFADLELSVHAAASVPGGKALVVHVDKSRDLA